MASNRTFTIGGTVVFNGVKAFRFATGKMNLRRNLLKHWGATDINLVDLPRPMTKTEAAAWLINQGFTGVVPTRAKDKTAKSPILVAAEKLAAKRARDAARKRAKRLAA
jgi:hypothetical protein